MKDRREATTVITRGVQFRCILCDRSCDFVICDRCVDERCAIHDARIAMLTPVTGEESTVEQPAYTDRHEGDFQ